MKGKIFLLVPLTLLALSIALPTKATTDWYVEAQLEIIGFEYVGLDPEERGFLFDVPFVGVAGGPNIIEGTVEGVDHVLIEWDFLTVHLNVYVTITDNEGDKISAHVTGRGVSKNPGLIIFEDAVGTIIDVSDYPTTGKYIGLVDKTFTDEGFVSGFSTDPPGGYIHVKWYWT